VGLGLSKETEMPKTMGRIARRDPDLPWLAAQVKTDGSAEIRGKSFYAVRLILHDAVATMLREVQEAKERISHLEAQLCEESDPAAIADLQHTIKRFNTRRLSAQERSDEYLKLINDMQNQEATHREKGYRAFK
jgi:hypothetical protein